MKLARTIFVVIAAALGLSACAEGYGYAYDYDPYLGPRGHYTSPSDHHHHAQADGGCSHVVYVGPYRDQWRGTYYAGPYCVGADGRVQTPGAATVEILPAATS